MSTFRDPISKKLRKARREGEQERELEKTISEEVEMSYVRVMMGVANPTPEFKVAMRALVRENVVLMRGMTARIEQLGANLTRMSALAHQAWDMCQVVTEYAVRRSMMARAAAEEAGIEGNLDLYGPATREDANREVSVIIGELTAQAQEEAKKGNAVTADSQTREVLEEVRKRHAEDLANMPSVQNLITPEFRKDQK